MKTLQTIGIVAEYNPFHNGHALHLAETRRIVGDLPIIAVMSGNFVQRGLPAITDKWTRASIAVKNGVDLVLELPAIFACRSAEHFARGAISTLQATGCVTHLSFGCETSDFSLLEQAASIASDNTSACQLDMDKGLSYAAAMSNLFCKKNRELAHIAKQPNNILAIEYLKQIKALDTDFLPLPVKRQESLYNDPEIKGRIASATAIREEFLTFGLSSKIEQAVPPTSFETLKLLDEKKRLGFSQKNLDLLLLFLLRRLSPEEIAARCECSEGLENKIIKAVSAGSWAETVSMIKSKRYPETRINRLLLQLLLSSTTETFTGAIAERPSYLRVLAFNSRGRKLLRTMRETATLPVITKLGKHILDEEKSSSDLITSLKIDLMSSTLFGLLQNDALPYAADFRTSPSYLPE